MSEHVYDNVSYDEEMKRGQQVEMVLNVYENTDTIRGRSTNTETENSNTTRNQQVQPSDTQGGDITWSMCYRVTVVCVVLLCVLLLSAITLLWIKFNILNTDHSQLQRNYNNLTIERDQLQTSKNNLTKERDQLQTSYNNLTIERDQLQTSKNNLTVERDQLQTSYNSLAIEKYQLQTSCNDLTKERDQLQTSYNNLNLERDQLQTSYNNLTIERDQLQTSYNTLTIERDQLQKERTMGTFCDLEKGRCFIFSSLYFMSNEKKSWTESRQYCMDKGADLVIINSRDEQEFIVKQLGSSEFWIGLSDRDTEGKWTWVDGTPLTTAFWSKGEPNNVGNEDCAEIYSYSYGNGWNDDLCSNKQRCICKKRLSQ